MTESHESHKDAPELLPAPVTEQPVETAPAQNATTVSKQNNRRLKNVIVILIVAIVFLIGGFIAARIYSTRQTNSNSITQRTSVGNDGNKFVTQEEEDIASVVEKVSPSVVSIVTKSTSNSYYGAYEQEGAGSGIIVSKDGYVLTNKHVIDGTSNVSVVLSDGTKYDDVKVLGSDPLNDVAFLRIPNVNNLKPAELGDSTSIKVGQKVIAIGNTLGQYQNTVTSGIISGTGRPVSAQAGNSVENLTDLIQTDAAINPGNSGGPLLNLAGQVIGVNTAIIKDAQGIGFAIPIGATKGILKGVLSGGTVKRAYLGINYIPITADAAKEYGLSVKNGAYVYNSEGSGVVSGSPADKAGIKNKDIITTVGGIEVGVRGSVSTLVAEYAPGDTIELGIIRGGNKMTVRVTLDSYK